MQLLAIELLLERLDLPLQIIDMRLSVGQQITLLVHQLLHAGHEGHSDVFHAHVMVDGFQFEDGGEVFEEAQVLLGRR